MTDEQTDQPRLLLVEEDDDTRRVLRRNLSRYGYLVRIALDEEDALERFNEGGFVADVMLVDLVGKSTDESLAVGRRIRRHARYDGRTPLVVMAEKYDADLEGTNVNVSENDWITYLEEHHQLKNLLARLVNRPPN